LHGLALSIVMMTALWGCAMKVAPTGGPRDTTPAEVVLVEPVSGTTSFTGRSVTFAFDDYVDRSIRNAITILPAVRFSVSYSGDEISVDFKEPLAANTTYTITLGTEWTDVRGNKPMAAYTTVFSSGPIVDTGQITGLVSAATLTGVSVFCYPYDPGFDTAFTPWNTRPRYLLPTGQSGKFSIKGLAHGRYRLLAVRDENRNGLIDAREDFAVAPSDITVDTAAARPVNLRLGPFIDLDSPELSRARSATSQLLILQFTEPAYPVRTWEDALEVRSADGRLIPVGAVWNDPTQRDRFFVRLRQPLDTSQTTLMLKGGALRDSAGNRSADTSVRMTFRGSALADTATLRIVRIEPRDSTKGVLRSQPLRITFSDAVDTNAAQLSIEHRSPQGAVQVRTRWASPVELVIEPQDARQLSTWYTTALTFADVRSVIGRILSDTAMRHALVVQDRPSDPGSMSGTFQPSAEMVSAAPLLIRVIAADGTIVATFQPEADGTFRLDAIAPGEYTVDVFGDRNRNGRHEYGSVRPFSFAEPWWPLPTKISIRPRWILENVRITP
jgi:hypothetical protein